MAESLDGIPLPSPLILSDSITKSYGFPLGFGPGSTSPFLKSIEIDPSLRPSIAIDEGKKIQRSVV
jgi:hypothetical protein